LIKTDDPYAYQRVGIWQSSVRLLRDFPVFGVGPGMYRYYGRVYNFPLEHQVARYAKAPNMAHNDLLQVGAELGVIGMLLMVGGAAMVASFAVKVIKRRPVSWHGVAASGGLFGLGIQSMVSNLLVSPAIVICSVVLVVLLIEEHWTHHQTSRSLRKVCARKWPWYLLLLVLFPGIFIFSLYVPTLAHIHYLRFYESFENRDYAAAVRHLSTAIRYVPIHAYYHHDLGMLHATAFENRPDLTIFQAGRREFATAIRLNPQNYEHYLALADFHEALFRSNPTTTNAHDALREYRRALKHSPFDPFIRYSMAALHAQILEYQEAIDILKEAIAMEPNFVGGYQLLGDMLLAIQRPQEARQAYEQAEAIMGQIPAESLNSEYARELVRSNKVPYPEYVD
jgi:tetratricopeptide (TPR) repeat protein